MKYLKLFDRHSDRIHPCTCETYFIAIISTLSRIPPIAFYLCWFFQPHSGNSPCIWMKKCNQNWYVVDFRCCIQTDWNDREVEKETSALYSLWFVGNHFTSTFSLGSISHSIAMLLIFSERLINKMRQSNTINLNHVVMLNMLSTLKMVYCVAV